MPDWWSPNHARVEPGDLVHIWLEEQDSVYHEKHEKFEQALEAWSCDGLVEQLKNERVEQHVAEGNLIDSVSIAHWMGKDDVLDDYYKPKPEDKNKDRKIIAGDE